MENSALIGLHGEFDELFAMEIAKYSGFSVYSADGLDDLMSQALSGKYSHIIMDINYGLPNIPEIEPVIKVYRLIEQQVKDGKIKFLGVSGRGDTVEAALKEGIPAMLKNNTYIDDFFSK